LEQAEHLYLQLHHKEVQHKEMLEAHQYFQQLLQQEVEEEVENLLVHNQVDQGVDKVHLLLKDLE
jgi:hypothetical protein